jgi:hypothetical protein
MGKGWAVAIRVTYAGEGAKRRARVHEVRVVPGEPGEFDPQRDYAMWEQRVGASRRRPFSFEMLRRRVTLRHLADALRAFVKTPADAADDDLADEVQSTDRIETVRRGGRPARPLRFYAKVALAYERIERNERREPQASTRAILAKRYKVNLTTIARWIHVARKRGLLTPVTRGSRGGMATEKARYLVEQGDK